MQRMAVLAVCLAGLIPPSATAADGKPVRIYVSARSQEPVPEADKKAREKEADAERKRLEQAAKDLDKTLTAKHGKRYEDWPEEARQQSEGGWQKVLAADLGKATVKFDEDLGNFATSLTNGLKDQAKKSPRIALADSADQADLAVELLARSAKTSFPAAAWMLYLKLTPAGSAAAAPGDAQFAEVKATKLGVGLLASSDVRGAVSIVHPYTGAEPYWIIRVFQQGTSYGSVVETAAGVLAAFGSSLAEEREKAGAP